MSSVQHVGDSSAGEGEESNVQLYRVLEVFPEVSIDHVQNLLRACGDSAEVVISILSEDSYPKSTYDHGGVLPSDGEQQNISPRDRVLELFRDVSTDYLEQLLHEFNNSAEKVMSVLSDGLYPRSKPDQDRSSPDSEENDMHRDRVLEVFPEVTTDHVQKLLRACDDSAEVVISILSEDSYPKSTPDHGGLLPPSYGEQQNISPRDRVFELFKDVSTDHLEQLLLDCNNSAEKVMSILSDGLYPRSKPDQDMSSSDGEENDMHRDRVLEVFPEVTTDHVQQLLQACNDSTDAVISILAEDSYPKRISDGGTVPSDSEEQIVALRDRFFVLFPDVCNKHLEKLLRDCDNAFEMVVSILSDGSYPKSKSDGGRPFAFGTATTVSSPVLTRKHAKPMYDYTSTSSFQLTQTYVDEAVDMLLYEFPFIRVDSMCVFMKEHKQHFTLVRNHILKSLKQGDKVHHDNATDDDLELQQFQSLKSVWVTKRPSKEQMRSIGIRRCTKRFVLRPLPTLTDPILRDEVSFAQQELETWMEMMDEKQKRCEARKRSKQSGSGMECGCCFDEVPIEEMVGCRNEGHLFCMDCIQSYADTQIFSNGSLGVIKATGKQACELVCFDSSGCQSGFFEEQLQRAFRVKTLERYTELQFRASIEASGTSEEICSCPKCGFQAYLPLNLVVFQCPMDDCRHESCRKCGKESHIPLRCDEVVQKQQREDEGRLKVEEALAEAKIRKCPKCTTPFVKSDGCNKIICRCGAKICYICQAELDKENPYSHFSDSKCVMYSNVEEDDQRAMREAGLTAAQAYRQELQETGGSDLRVNIDVDRIMHVNPLRDVNLIKPSNPVPRRRRSFFRRF